MPRTAIFNEKRILDAAARLVSERGPAAATMTAIGHSIGAPNGSIYHRFKSRDELMGRVWLTRAKDFQDRWVDCLKSDAPALEVGLRAALTLPEGVREDLDSARIMLLFSREDFLSDDWPAEMKAEGERLVKQFQDGLSAMTKRIFGKETAHTRRVTSFATLDIPFAAVRKYAAQRSAPPRHVDAMITRAYRAVIEAELADFAKG